MSRRIHLMVSLVLTAALLLLLPSISFSQAQGMQFKVAFSAGTYTVYMTPNATPVAPNLTLSSQVTLKVPHGTGANAFTVTNIQSLVPTTSWTLDSRINAPTDAPGFDYLSFGVTYTASHDVFQWTANTEVPLFSFQNSGACLAEIALMEDSDIFAQLPNSAGTNPGNQIRILTLGALNSYIGTYGGPASCLAPTDTPTATPTNTPTLTNTPTATPTNTPTLTNTPTATPTNTPTPINTSTATPTNTPTTTPTTVGARPDLVTTLGQLSPALQVGILSSLPVTITNQGQASATGPLQTTITLPAGVSAPATFTSNGWSCTTTGNTITCTNPSSVSPGARSGFLVPVTPAASMVGTIPGPFVATTAPASGETATSNNTSALLTPSTPVAAEPTDPDDNPKPVTLVSFTSRWTTNGVNLSWETSNELAIFGFQFYRSEDGDRSHAVLVSPEIVVSKGLNGGMYTYLDRAATPGTTYTYWLATVSTDSSTSDAASDIAIASQANIFLPLISNH